MASLNFPSTPTDGQTYTGDNGITYIYNAATGLWRQSDAVNGVAARTAVVLMLLGSVNGERRSLYVPWDISFPANAAGSGGTATQAGSGISATYTLRYKPPALPEITVGTAVYGIGATEPTVSFSSAWLALAGSLITAEGPATANATLRNPSITLNGSKV